MKSIKDLLTFVPLYVGLQRAIGADRLRHRCIDEAALQPGEAVLDVGCGPAYYFERLPQPIEYHGFDTDARYLAWAREKWGSQATFHLGVFSADSTAGLPRFDAILLLGLLHHLPDDEARDLLALAASVLRPSGRLVAVDTCYENGQGRVSRWISDNDRGEHVRTPDAFAALAEGRFSDHRGSVLRDLTRVPGSYYVMQLRGPVVPAELHR